LIELNAASSSNVVEVFGRPRLLVSLVRSFSVQLAIAHAAVTSIAHRLRIALSRRVDFDAQMWRCRIRR
jgi:hypothetical protein